MFPGRNNRSSDIGGSVVQYAESGPFGWIYAIGNITATFPRKDLEKEFQQIVAAEKFPTGTPYEQILYNVLSKPENLFLTQEMAWVFQRQCVPSYLLRPRSDVELKQFVQSINPEQNPTGQAAYDVIIGAQEPIPPPGAMHRNLPWVTVNRLFHFVGSELLQKLTPPKGVNPQVFQAQVTALFNDMLQLGDNTGDNDAHRALNYISLAYPEIYSMPWNIPTNPVGGTVLFTGVEAQRSALSGEQVVMDVIFKYVDQSTNVVSRYYTSVDVTGQFPFLVTKLQPYFER